MTVFSFNEFGKAYVPEQEFLDYVTGTAERDDYMKVMRRECQVGPKDWRVCECMCYFNSAGCLLAVYNRDFQYGFLV